MALIFWLRTLDPATLQRAAVHVFMAFALLFPSCYLLLDADAAERIPTHQHLVPWDQPIPPHVHNFERRYLPQPSSHDGSVKAFIGSPAAAVAAASAELAPTASPLLNALGIALIARAGLWFIARNLRSQILFAPPLHPPCHRKL